MAGNTDDRGTRDSATAQGDRSFDQIVEGGSERSTSRTAPRRTSGATIVAGSDRSRTETSAGASRTSASEHRPTATVGAGEPARGKRQPPRRIRLTLARIDPFSVMKLSFLVAIAFGVATIIATMILWGMVDAMGLWDQLTKLGKDMSGGKELSFMQYFTFSKFVSYSVIVSVLNLVIITALGTLLAFLYNIVASLLGGLKFTFTDR